MSGKQKMWLPLESNPTVMQTYLEMMGAKKGSFEVADVYGLDEELLAMVPPLAVAVLMLFPITEKLEESVSARDKAEREAAGADAATTSAGAAPWPIPKDLFFMEQLVGNACGTIGLLHALVNNYRVVSDESATATSVAADAHADKEKVAVAQGSFVDAFVKATVEKGMNPLDIGRHFENSDQADSLHLNAAVSGQSELPDDSKGEDHPHNRIYHFVAFVAKDGFLWELDGRRPYARRCGPCEGNGMPLLKAAAETIGWFMAEDPENIQFGLTALVASGDEDGEKVNEDL